jgi:phosphoribosylformylglycinamidine synthase
MKAKVFVTLKRGVLDPAGKAVLGGLHHLGYDDVRDVRIGKFFEIEVADGPDARARLERMADQLLANTVIETFRVEIP